MKAKNVLGNRRGNHNITGERGLLTALIAQAQNDFVTGKGKAKHSAVLYFASKQYIGHLHELGLHPSMLPEGVRFGLRDILDAVLYLASSAGVDALETEPALFSIYQTYQKGLTE